MFFYTVSSCRYRMVCFLHRWILSAQESAFFALVCGCWSRIVCFLHCHHLVFQVVRFLHCLFPVTLSNVFLTLAAYPKCGIGFYLYQVSISYYCAYEKTTKYYWLVLLHITDTVSIHIVYTGDNKVLGFWSETFKLYFLVWKILIVFLPLES